MQKCDKTYLESVKLFLRLQIWTICNDRKEKMHALYGIVLYESHHITAKSVSYLYIHGRGSPEPANRIV